MEPFPNDFRPLDVNSQPNAEKTQRLFASLREELEKRGRGHLVNGATNG